VAEGPSIGEEFFSPARLTLADVKAMDRWAWRPSGSGEFPTFFYDGIHFWWQPRQFERVMLTRAIVPNDGWRHRATCNCTICRAAGEKPDPPG
jgi:hypothetical protein